MKIPGININAADKDGNTPLHVAAEKGITWSTRISFFTICEGNFDVMAVLAAVPGVNLAAKNQAGNTPIHVAAQEGIIWWSTSWLLFYTFHKGNSDVMALLMTAPGANLAMENDDGKTVEQLARYSSNWSNVTTLKTF